jgi:hypothetical protein
MRQRADATESRSLFVHSRRRPGVGESVAFTRRERSACSEGLAEFRSPVSGGMPSTGVAWSILRVGSVLAVLLVVAGLVALAPSASADKIIFTSVNRGGGGLVVMRPSGKVVSVARRFVKDSYDVSLDGRRLVRGVGLRRGAGLGVNLFTARDRLVLGDPRIVARAFPGIGLRWSPNGRFVAGARMVGGFPPVVEFPFQVFVVRVGSGRARRLRTSVPMLSPSWSPDSRRIVASGPQGLWVINVATGAAREILSLGEDEVGAPAWSPDGRWIAFDRNPPPTGVGAPPLGSSQLWLVRPNGSGLRQLTHLTDADIASAPAWSPDGRRLAFITTRGRSSWPVATIRANGSGLRTLYTSGLQNYGIDWSR